MSLIDVKGKKVQLNEYFDQIFDVNNSIQLIDWENPSNIEPTTYTFTVPVPETGGRFCINPYGYSINSIVIHPTISFLDSEMNPITIKSSSGYVQEITNFSSNSSVDIDGKTIVTGNTYTNIENLKLGKPTYKSTYSVESNIAYMRIKLVGAYSTTEHWGMTAAEDASYEYIPYGTISAEVKDVSQYWKQFASKIIQYGAESDDFMRYIRCESIRQMNHSRDCIRVGTFNKSISIGEDNNDGMKQMFADYGIDFVGMQEVGNYMDNYPEALTSYALPYVDNAETADKSPYIDNKVLSRYPIKTSTRVTYTVPEENQATQEWRGYTRCEIPLPRYKDYYPDGDQVLSFYVTHFDPDTTSRLSEVDELIAALQEDKNKFKIVVADTNDFDLSKPTWKAFTDAGFVKIHDGSSKTVTRDEALNKNSALDNIFCSPNISVVYYDIVNTTNRQILLTNGAMSPMSDHDFVYADLKLNYEL